MRGGACGICGLGTSGGTGEREWPYRIDVLLEVSIAGSFSRAGYNIRRRVLPEFRAYDPPAFDGRIAIVTGATAGLGLAMATELARRRGLVHLLARDRAKAARTRENIIAATGNPNVSYGLADMTEPDSLRRFAADFRAIYGRLDVLIHNAGAMNNSYSVTAGGIERTYAGQVVGPFLLTRLLLPELRTAAPSRVITVSSGGMYTQPLARSAVPCGPDGYRGAVAYARAKRVQVAVSAEWARRTPRSDIAFHAMHPGWADTPGIAAGLPRFYRLMRRALRTPEQGADTAVWLATADPAALGTGCFWHDRRPRPVNRIRRPPPGSERIASELWDQLARQTDPAAGDQPGGERATEAEERSAES